MLCLALVPHIVTALERLSRELAPTDDGLLQAEVQHISTLEAQLTLARARTHAKIFQLLNAEQQAKARQLITEMEQRRPRRWRERLT